MSKECYYLVLRAQYIIIRFKKIDFVQLFDFCFAVEPFRSDIYIPATTFYLI
jgi:hypothetical protein